ncbi:hypothetical protein FFJ24_005685 [Pedobacter sp. KBS0701]|uniref:hypothetical protein n=1 Tax=Pedobacter sp. KBS0701 TaxID=2578106 RepID=UPI00110DBA1D|nr:hypothetical protein [Pedobacter sp. KBS0701]QDW24342.1 hypothetical protein FFJ24_005685 [Pedobacter sp. KBS0701]
MKVKILTAALAITTALLVCSSIYILNTEKTAALDPAENRSQDKAAGNGVSKPSGQNEQDLLHTYRINLISGIKSNGADLKATELKSMNGSTGLIGDSLRKRNPYTLVYRFTEFHCASCVNAELKFFRSAESMIGKENMLIFGAYKNNRIFSRTLKAYDVSNYKAYNVRELDVFAEEFGYPYFFVIDNNSVVSNTFVPDKATPEITKEYLAMIQQRFFPG